MRLGASKLKIAGADGPRRILLPYLMYFDLRLFFRIGIKKGCLKFSGSLLQMNWV
jgi:hypothetical protein